MKILVVVDMQNDFIDGALGTPEAQAIVPKVVEKIKKYKEKGDAVICTMDTHYPNYLDTMEGKKLPVPHCIRLTDGWLMNKDVLEALGEYDDRWTTTEKRTFGSRAVTALVHHHLWDGDTQIDPAMIEVVGLCTDICVISNVMLLKAEFPNAPIVVDSSCCAGVTPESHQRALEAMKMCHIDII